MAATEIADDGVQIPVYSTPMDFGYTGTNLTSITVVYGDNTYVQTFTYAGANVTNISGWELQ